MCRFFSFGFLYRRYFSFLVFLCAYVIISENDKSIFAYDKTGSSPFQDAFNDFLKKNNSLVGRYTNSDCPAETASTSAVGSYTNELSDYNSEFTIFNDDAVEDEGIMDFVLNSECPAETAPTSADPLESLLDEEIDDFNFSDFDASYFNDILVDSYDVDELLDGFASDEASKLLAKPQKYVPDGKEDSFFSGAAKNPVSNKLQNIDSLCSFWDDDLPATNSFDGEEILNDYDFAAPSTSAGLKTSNLMKETNLGNHQKGTKRKQSSSTTSEVNTSEGQEIFTDYPAAAASTSAGLNKSNLMTEDYLQNDPKRLKTSNLRTKCFSQNNPIELPKAFTQAEDSLENRLKAVSLLTKELPKAFTQAEDSLENRLKAVSLLTKELPETSTQAEDSLENKLPKTSTQAEDSLENKLKTRNSMKESLQRTYIRLPRNVSKAKVFLGINDNDTEVLENYYRFFVMYYNSDETNQRKIEKFTSPIFQMLKVNPGVKLLSEEIKRRLFENIKMSLFIRDGEEKICSMYNSNIFYMNEEQPQPKIDESFAVSRQRDLYFVDMNHKINFVLDFMDFNNIEEQFKSLYLNIRIKLGELYVYSTLFFEKICNTKKSFYSIIHLESGLTNKMFNLAREYIEKKYGIEKVMQLISEVNAAIKNFLQNIGPTDSSLAMLSQHNLYYLDYHSKLSPAINALDILNIYDQFRYLHLIKRKQMDIRLEQIFKTETICKQTCRSKISYHMLINLDSVLINKIYETARAYIAQTDGCLKVHSLERSVNAAIKRLVNKILPTEEYIEPSVSYSCCSKKIVNANESNCVLNLGIIGDQYKFVCLFLLVDKYKMKKNVFLSKRAVSEICETMKCFNWLIKMDPKLRQIYFEKTNEYIWQNWTRTKIISVQSNLCKRFFEYEKRQNDKNIQTRIQ